MSITDPNGTVHYAIEQAIKEYRKFAQRELSKVVPDITIDQCLILFILRKQSTTSQKEIAHLIFKDFASVTRMLDLLVKKTYLKRSPHNTDRRKAKLELTDKSTEALESLEPVVIRNRKRALKGLSAKEVGQLETSLQKIIANCRTASS